MNLAAKIDKLKRDDRAGCAVTVDELEALLSLIRTARDGIVQRHGCDLALTILNSIVGDDGAEETRQ